MKIIHTDQAPKAIGPYSQAVQGGGLLFVSGQIAIDPATGQLEIGDLETEMKRIFANGEAILIAGGASLKSVVRATVYLKDMNHFARVNEIYGRYFKENPPARACVEVARLPRDVNVEIDFIAEIQS